MDSFETGDKITIVNRSKEHRISKELIREIPYFERMLSHDLKESKENKVELDFNEQALKVILNCVELDYMLIEMATVINLCNIIDYFGMDNDLMDDCVTYFHDNFTIEHLPIVVPQVTAASRCINSEALNGFICRHFLKIANTKVWLNYPIEIVEYILNLNLVVHSEKQVFNVISRWVNNDSRSRMRYAERLLYLVRWHHFTDVDFSEITKNEFLKSAGFHPVLWQRKKRNCHRAFNRVNQNYFIMIEHLIGTNLNVKVIDSNFVQLFGREVELDESIPLDVFHDEHVSDIFFDSGKRGIRIDWSRNKYRWLDLSTSRNYYSKIEIYINGRKEAKSFAPVSHGNPTSSPNGVIENAHLETTEKFIWLYKFRHCAYIQSSWHEKFDHKDYHATFLGDNIYMLTSSRYFIRFDSVFQEIERSRFKNTFGEFEDLLITSSQVNDDRVIVVDKTTKDFLCYNVKSKEWSSIDVKINNDSTDCQMNSDELIAFTSAFLPIDAIRSYMNPELS
ncbi:uncharacterized protein LOC107371246 [Tetranychus urticae]|uniref:BACK domain-containing protein n=1 Tax=Tetranychus urticae TaxID=32264 RepID=T1JYB3_TETUR|nr:uncharacterized protein LOC107371246 [Tetranychus urticae]